MATQAQVDSYIASVKDELVTYGDKVAIMNQHGNKPDFPKELKFNLLQCYVDIADKYLDKWDSSIDDNVMTSSEFETIMTHINTICNSFYWLELN